MTTGSYTVTLGLRPNLGQFTLLVLVNAFVGSMVGMERTILPLLAEEEFGLAARSAILSFILGFGLTKAFANLAAGRLADTVGRKKLLIAGWLFGLPVPLLLIWAPEWGWVVFANVLLGLNQGLAWSATVIMKVDLAGPTRRGLALGLNEFAGYVAVAITALATGYIASAYSLRPGPFYLGIGVAVAGLLVSVLLVRETLSHAELEARTHNRPVLPGAGAGVEHAPRLAQPSGRQVLALTTWRDRALFCCSQAGLVNNLNDGLVWGLLPVFFADKGLPVDDIGVVMAVYPAVWGILQLGTGPLSDHLGRKWLIASGMVVQALALGLFVLAEGLMPWTGAAAALGLGTAMVYPTLLAAVSDVASPSWRATAVGVYRLWRDLGFAAGALIGGIVADLFSIPAAIVAVAAITGASGVIVALLMYETLRKPAYQGP